jgi:hypothetical protein
VDCEGDVKQDSVKAFQLQNGFRMLHVGRIGSGANGNPDRIVSEHEVENKVGDHGEDDNAKICKQTSKLVSKSGRIFEPKNEEVSSEGDTYEEEVKLRGQTKSQIVVHLTDKIWQRSNDVPKIGLKKLLSHRHSTIYYVLAPYFSAILKPR